MKKSAGILLWRKLRGNTEVLLAHPGGPFFAKKDDGAWTVPKGLVNRDENLLLAAKREFFEETGMEVQGECVSLGEINANGKIVAAFACEGDFDPTTLRSNLFEIEWPPRSGKKQSFPEIDRAEWFSIESAERKLNPNQTPFLVALKKGIEEVI